MALGADSLCIYFGSIWSSVILFFLDRSILALPFLSRRSTACAAACFITPTVGQPSKRDFVAEHPSFPAASLHPVPARFNLMQPSRIYFIHTYAHKEVNKQHWLNLPIVADSRRYTAVVISPADDALFFYRTAPGAPATPEYGRFCLR